MSVSVATPRLGLGALALAALFTIALVLIAMRFAFGLEAIANINDAYPWGWWIGFGVMSFISLGACGFTIALLVDVLGMHRYEPLVRPALVCGLLLYLSYAMILGIEIGRPWKGWIVFFSWAHTSALFEVAWCATTFQKGIDKLGQIQHIPTEVQAITIRRLH